MKLKDVLNIKIISAVLLVCIFACLLAGAVGANAEGEEGKPPVVYSGEALLSAVSSGFNATSASSVDCPYIGEEVLALSLNMASNDPYADFIPSTPLSADDYKYVVINVRTDSDLTSHTSAFRIYTDTEGAGHYSESHAISVKYAPSAGWQTMVFDMTGVYGWNGNINKLRLDYFQSGEHEMGEAVYIYDVTFLSSGDAVADIVSAMGNKINDRALASSNAAAIFKDFTEEELSFFGGKYKNQTLVTLSDGNIVFTADSLSDPHDPFVDFDYPGIAAHMGQAELSAEQVGHVVLRYTMDNNVTAPIGQIFHYAGNVEVPTGGYSVDFEGRVSNNWTLTDVKLSGENGWSGRINGLRIDWCADARQGAQMVIDSIIFFANGTDSSAYVAASSMYYGTDFVYYELPPEDTAIPDDDDFFGEETETDTQPEETATEEEMPTFEEIPTFPEETTTPAQTEGQTTEEESTTESEPDVTTESEPEETTEPETEESTTAPTGGSSGNNTQTPPSDTTEPEEKSKVPFYAASISMSVMTLAAIVLIAVLKIKELIVARRG